MDDLSKRLAALTAEQRELLELRLRKKGLESAVSAGTATAPANVAVTEVPDDPDWKERKVERAISFSLYFFSDDGSKNSDDKYRLLIESAKFADSHGLTLCGRPNVISSRLVGCIRIRLC
jgi:hypothetical protein